VFGFPSPFVVYPATIKVANEHAAERSAAVCFSEVWPHLECAIKIRKCFLEVLQFKQGDATISERLGLVRRSGYVGPQKLKVLFQSVFWPTRPGCVLVGLKRLVHNARIRNKSAVS
jgi:hypothetical protein